MTIFCIFSLLKKSGVKQEKISNAIPFLDEPEKGMAANLIESAKKSADFQLNAIEKGLRETLKGFNLIDIKDTDTPTILIKKANSIEEIIKKYKDCTDPKQPTTEEHPFKEVIDLYSGGQGSKKQIGGNDKDKELGRISEQLNSIMNYPFAWRTDLSKVYMNNHIIKMLSIPLGKLRNIEYFKKDTDIKLKALALGISWDATPLLAELEKIDGYTNARLSLLEKSNIYSAKVQPYGFNNSNLKFLMTEDIIEFYTELSNEFLLRKTIDSNRIPLYIRLAKDYNLWKELSNVFNKFHEETNIYIKDINEHYKDRTDQVITYLKVRCDSMLEYNRYFNVFTEVDPLEKNTQETKPKRILIAGPGPNIRVKLNNTINIPDDNILQRYGLKRVKNSFTKIEVEQYSYSYLYGPFTRIFGPKMNNNDISKKCNEITKSLKDGKNVFVIGYGASGAGKTSSLIYFNKGKTYEETDGILINICRACEASNITLNVYELFGGKNGELTDNTTIKYENIPIIKTADGNYVFIPIITISII
jgi:hypothetical protein